MFPSAVQETFDKFTVGLVRAWVLRRALRDEGLPPSEIARIMQVAKETRRELVESARSLVEGRS